MHVLVTVGKGNFNMREFFSSGVTTLPVDDSSRNVPGRLPSALRRHPHLEVVSRHLPRRYFDRPRAGADGQA